MHALFPDLLFLGPYFAPLILRVGVGLYFLFHAERHWKQKTDRSKLLALKEAAFGLLFLAGFLTQLVALAGILVVLLRGIWLKKDAAHEPWGLKLVVVSALLALVISGAGAFAIDTPY